MSSKPAEFDVAQTTAAAKEKERIDVEASRQKRMERVKAKYRDRGGIYKPAEINPLVDILLSRDVSGLSPSKKAAQRRRSSAAPGTSTARRSTIGKDNTPATHRRKSSVRRGEYEVGEGKELAVEKASKKPQKTAGSSQKKSAASSKNSQSSRTVDHPPAGKAAQAASSTGGTAIKPHSKSNSAKATKSSVRDDSTSKATQRSQSFPLVDLSSVAGPSPAPTRKAPTKKRARAVIDSDEVEAGEADHSTKALRVSPRKRAKITPTDTGAKRPSDPSTSVKEKGKGKRESLNDLDDHYESEIAAAAEPSRSSTKNSIRRKPSAKAIGSSKRRDKAQSDDDSRGNVTASESDVESQSGSKRKKRGAARSKGKAATRAKGRKRAVLETESDGERVSPRRRSLYPAPQLETVYEEDEQEVDSADRHIVDKQSLHKEDSSKGHKRLRKDGSTDVDAEDKKVSTSRKRLKATANEEELGNKENSHRKLPSKPKTKATATTDEVADEQVAEPTKRTKSQTKASLHEDIMASPEGNKENELHAGEKDSEEPARDRRPSSRGSAAKSKAQRSRPTKSKSTGGANSRATRSKSKLMFPKAAPVKSSFANQPTLLFSSPVKPGDAEPDEIDFLS